MCWGYDMKIPKHYLAAPFFNPAQVELVQNIENIFREVDVPLFSPRLQSGNKQPLLTPDVAREIKEINKAQIEINDLVLAVVDWKLPIHQEVRVIQRPDSDLEIVVHHEDVVISPPLNIPDAGVCWELGYAEARAKPIIIFTERPKDAGLNLMLTQGCAGVVYGLDHLRCYVNLGKPDGQVLAKWEGRNL